MKTKKHLIWLWILTLAGIVFGTFAQTIETISLVPNLDISRFAPYTIQVNTSGDIVSWKIELSVTDSSSSTCWNYYVDGACDSETLLFPLIESWTNTRIKTNIYPDYIYPEIFFAPSETTWYNEADNISIRRRNYHLLKFANPFTMTDDMSFWIEFNAVPVNTNNSNDLYVYIVGTWENLSYFENDWRNKPNTELVATFNKNSSFHHTHTEHSSHHLVALSTNPDSTIGSKNINVAWGFWIILYQDSVAENRWRDLKYHEWSLCTNTAARYRGDRSWGNTRNTPIHQQWCPDTHIHIARRSGTIDYVQANIELSYDNEGTIETISDSQLFSFASLPNIPPNPTSFNTPISGSYKSDILIARNTGTDANNDLLTYNVSLVDSGGNFIAELINNTTETSYTLDSTTYTDDYYHLTWTVCDAEYCVLFALDEMFFIDNTPPVINLIGDSEITVEVWWSYFDSWATASDNFDGDISSEIQITGNINMSLVWLYTMTYNISDSAWNNATEVIRTVNVVDTTLPVITLNGTSPTYVEFGNNYIELWATWSDNVDGNWTISIISWSVNTWIIWSYSLEYIYVDNAWNTWSEYRTINIVDTTPPIISLSGDHTITIEVYSIYSDAGATASDNYDGIITHNIITVNNVNTWTIWTYNITYTISDSSWNPATEVTRTVNVVDTTPPIITLIWDNPQTIQVGNSYIESSASAIDNYNWDISSNVVIDDSTINTNAIWSYIVTYNISDSSWNPAIEVSRTVNVVDTIFPIVSEWYISAGNINTGNDWTTIFYNWTINIRADVSDVWVGINDSSCKYTIDDSNWSSANHDIWYCYINSLSPNTDINIRFSVEDGVGNLTTWNVWSYIYDNTQPNTTNNANSTTGNSDVTVILNPTDTWVWVSGTYYCIDNNGTCTPNILWTSVLVTGNIWEITHKFVRYYSLDKLGNTEWIQTSVQIHIDKENPYLTGTTTFSSNNTTNSGYAKIGDTITITFTSHEALTGTPILTIVGGSTSTGTVNPIGGNTYSATYIMKDTDNEGTISFDITMNDLAGNTDTERVHSTIIFDRTPPAGIIITAPTTLTYFQWWTNKTITWTTGTETNIWPTSLQLQFSNDGRNTLHSVITTGTSNNWSYNRTFPVVDSTLASVRIIATDLAWNITYITGEHFTLDSTPPTNVSFTYPIGVVYFKWGSGYTITRSGGTDNFLSGKVLEYLSGWVWTHITTITTDSFSYLRTPPSAGISANTGTIRLRIAIYDRAGLNKTAETANFIVDSTMPTLSLSNASTTIRKNTNTTITATSSDALAWIRDNGVQYRTDMAFTTACTWWSSTPPTFTEEGIFTGYACVQDKAGNTRTIAGTYKIDKTPPTLQVPTTITTNTATIITITWTDTLAGISWYIRSMASGPTGWTTTFNTPTSQFPTVSWNVNGTYTLQVLARDNANNITTGTIAFVRDTIAPILTWATSVLNTTSQTPNYSFTWNEGGTISYSGWCTSATTTAISGNNTITFSTLSNGTYASCQLRVTDQAGNNSARLSIPSFTVNYTPPSWGGWWWWGGGFFAPTCTIQDLVCGINGKYTSKTGSSCQWWDLWKSCGTDICIDGDYSWDPNDGICYDPTKIEAKTGTTSTGKRMPFVSPFNKELTDAYSYAFGVKITTVPKIERANMTGILIRSHLAKMMSEYSIKVIGKTPDTTRKCLFKDMEQQSDEFKKYAILACQLGLMGLKTDGTPGDIFNPNGEVTRAIFGTTLSRALFEGTYNGGQNRYEKHLQALQKNGVMTMIDKPFNRELRGYVMMMMMRADQKLKKSPYTNFSSLRGSSVFVANKTTTAQTTPINTTEEQNFIKNIDKNFQFSEGYIIGQNNPGVKYLQYFLKTKTYYTGNINGINNATTVAALFKFQFDNNIVKKESDQWAGYLWPTTRDIINPLLQKLLNP